MEEQFEDYGEGEDVDFSNPCPEDDTRTNGFSGLGSSSLPSRSVVTLESTYTLYPGTHFTRRVTKFIVIVESVSGKQREEGGFTH